RVIQPKSSIDVATAPSCATARAWLRTCGGARRASAFATADGAPSGAVGGGRGARARVRDGGRGDERADEVAAAALVLLRRARAVLVRANGDVLGAVIGREIAAAQRERGRRDREE